MSSLAKRWYRSRRNQMLIVLILLSCLIYYTTFNNSGEPGLNLDITRRDSIIKYIEKRLQEALKIDKGSGCEIPHLDPFAKEVIQFDKETPKVTCEGQDWVECYHSECRVKPSILATTSDVVCSYRDIVYEDDSRYHLSAAVAVHGAGAYRLETSDHVRVSCTGRHKYSSNKKKILPSKWVGIAAGFRGSVKPPPPPPGREGTYNVLIFGFDSTSKNGFIRRMPKSYNYLLMELKATVLNGYNIVGDGTPAALFPILSGKTELEMPDVRKKMHNHNTLDVDTFIFSKLRADGYRTAYFEDSPSIGTFQYRFNGFNRQPADHYLRAFYLEDGKTYGRSKEYCVGAEPRYRLMTRLTRQFLELDAKKYIFTFIADITHNDFNMISTADEDTVEFFKWFKESGRAKDTLLFVMGDHGPRYASVRSTLQGRLEERLPLMAIRLPDSLASRRPETRSALEANADALSTPHDVHAAVLDALGLTRLGNPHRVQGADLPRGMSLLQPSPRLMAIRLPDSLASRRPETRSALEANADALSTPHDVHAAVLDALGLTRLGNPHRVQGADLPRGMSLLQPIPRNRSCSEAGIEPHWCACVSWRSVPANNPLHQRAADALVGYINWLTDSVRAKCVPRTLSSIAWVMQQRPNEGVLSFKEARDADGYVGVFGPSLDAPGDTYQAKITVGPGEGVFEASMTYSKETDKFEVDIRDISRTNKYNHEPDCIHLTHPHLNMFCYCKDQTT